MRYYGIRYKNANEIVRFKMEKLKRFCLQYTTLSKKKRDRRKANYDSFFRNPYHFRDGNLEIPADKYCTPICAITCDLILRENIPQLKSGLKKLLKENLSHKFVGNFQSVERIYSCIESMDNTLTSWYTWINIGRFDFEKNSLLKNYISYFDIYIRIINSSYLAIETHIYFAESFSRKQIDIINNDYQYVRGYISPALINNQKTSGGRKTLGIGYYSNTELKSDLIYENFTLLKWKFYRQLQRYFPTFLHSRGVPPPTIYIYKTNISYTEKAADKFWPSVGIINHCGQFIDESRKLFFEIRLNKERSFHKKKLESKDLIYLVNDTTINHEGGYYSIDSQIIHEFGLEATDSIFKFLLLNIVNIIVADKLVNYKLKLNNVKLRKNKLHQLLRLRYLYERDIDFYKRYVHEDIWKRCEEKVANIFDNQKPWQTYNYQRLTEYPVRVKNKLLKEISAINEEFDAKTSVLQHLSAYKNEVKNRIINIAMLLFTATTLLFVIFPKWSENVAKFLEYIWLIIKNYI